VTAATVESRVGRRGDRAEVSDRRTGKVDNVPISTPIEFLQVTTDRARMIEVIQQGF